MGKKCVLFILYVIVSNEIHGFAVNQTVNVIDTDLLDEIHDGTNGSISIEEENNFLTERFGKDKIARIKKTQGWHKPRPCKPPFTTCSTTTESPTTISLAKPIINTSTVPTTAPITAPTAAPTTMSTTKPITAPTIAPTTMPTTKPISAPTTTPTIMPTTKPITVPTTSPTTMPTTKPITAPTTAPTTMPINSPITAPATAPTTRRTTSPTTAPTTMPTTKPITAPTTAPTAMPITVPTTAPTTMPTTSPITASATAPTTMPTTELTTKLIKNPPTKPTTKLPLPPMTLTTTPKPATTFISTSSRPTSKPTPPSPKPTMSTENPLAAKLTTMLTRHPPSVISTTFTIQRLTTTTIGGPLIFPNHDEYKPTTSTDGPFVSATVSTSTNTIEGPLIFPDHEEFKLLTSNKKRPKPTLNPSPLFPKPTTNTDGPFVPATGPLIFPDEDDEETIWTTKNPTLPGSKPTIITQSSFMPSTLPPTTTSGDVIILPESDIDILTTKKPKPTISTGTRNDPVNKTTQKPATSITSLPSTTVECISRCPVTPEYNPVCGTNGLTYSNLGRLICAQNCGTDVTFLSRGPCRTSTTSAPATTTEKSSVSIAPSSENSAIITECIRNCPVTSEYNPVCGNNGLTYANPGRFICARDCGVAVSLLSQGPCSALTSAPVTTTEKLSVSIAPSSENSTIITECIRNCPVTSEYNPVCGTNGLTYANPGRFMCAQECGVAVRLLSQGPCPASTTSAPVTTTEKSSITIAPLSENSTIIAECIRNCAVTSEYNPVCGTNGLTYANPGRFVCARDCGVAVRLLSQGPCSALTSAPTTEKLFVSIAPSSENSTIITECIRNCPVTSEYNPVCGTNGLTYANPGRFICAQECGVAVRLLSQGPCPASITSAPVTTTEKSSITIAPLSENSTIIAECIRNCAVTSEYNPVCGTNGLTYANPGRFICARDCGVVVRLLSQGPCSASTSAPVTSTEKPSVLIAPSSENSTIISECIRNCPVTPEYNPVCGTNGLNYSNYGRLICAQNCGVAVTLLSRRPCSASATSAPVAAN